MKAGSNLEQEAESAASTAFEVSHSQSIFLYGTANIGFFRLYVFMCMCPLHEAAIAMLSRAALPEMRNAVRTWKRMLFE